VAPEAEPGIVTSGRTPVDTGGATFGAVGDERPPVAEETGGVVLGFGMDAPPGLPTGALEMLPLPTGAFGASNAPFAAPGAVNLLLRSVD